jgi:hypothetical protein
LLDDKGEGENSKNRNKPFQDDENITYFDCDSEYMTIYIKLNTKNMILLYVHYILMYEENNIDRET